MTVEIKNPEDIKTTPTGMAPASQSFFVVQHGYQTVLDARNPFARYQLDLEVDGTFNPIEAREWRTQFAQKVMDAINTGES